MLPVGLPSCLTQCAHRLVRHCGWTPAVFALDLLGVNMGDARSVNAARGIIQRVSHNRSTLPQNSFNRPSGAKG
jgi:hypothetical protein